MRTPIDDPRSGRRRLTFVLGLVVSTLLAAGLLPAIGTGGDSGGPGRLGQPPRRKTVSPGGRIVLHAGVPVAFPLAASADGRHLQDQGGQPFPILGRAAWDLARLSVADYQLFLDDTAAKGFNAVKFEAIYCDSISNNRPYSGNGQLPFTKRLDGQAWSGSFSYANINAEAPDFTQPNPSYWTHIDGILSYAASKGILCFLFPAYVGNNGSLNWGWMQIMSANGTAKMTTYGSWIAGRYRSYSNIVWMLGGDDGAFSGNNLLVERALLSGLQSVSGQLSTNVSALWDGDSIYTTQSDATLKAAGTLQGAYTWNSVAQWCRNAYAASPAMPAFLVEGLYDEEGPDGTNVNPGATQPCRRFQWWAWLSSIGGYIAGNGYTWLFNATGYASPWTSHLNTQTQQDNARLNAFIKSVPWNTLVPSGLGGMGTIVTAGGSTPDATDYVAAAANPAGTLLVAYVPPDHSGTVTVDMTTMSGAARARWFNPTTAAYTLISSSIANSGTHTFTPPGNNGSGYDDWVLVLEAPP